MKGIFMGFIILFLIIIFIFGGARVGRVFAKLVKGTAKTTGNVVDRTVRESGGFVKGALEEFRGKDGDSKIIYDEKICTNCGQEVSENVRFCPNCGSKIY
ncbi:zinc-ribbon domain-containing protein [Streptococcus thermophilus]|nr:zinc-ribbon domain-containing protein [Streptococcus thermophilus]